MPTTVKNKDVQKYFIGLHQIYGKDEVTIPDGWEYVAFRHVAAGDNYINKYDGCSIAEARTWLPPRSSDGPRIIVRRKPEPPQPMEPKPLPALYLALYPESGYWRSVTNNEELPILRGQGAKIYRLNPDALIPVDPRDI